MAKILRSDCGYSDGENTSAFVDRLESVNTNDYVNSADHVKE